MRRFIAIFVLITAVLPCQAWTFASDSMPEEGAVARETVSSAELFRPSKLIAPGVLFTAGVVGVNWDWYAKKINVPIKDYTGGLRAEWGYTKAENWIQYAPLATYMGLGAIGLGDHSFMEHFFAAGTAWAAEGVLVNALKYTLCEMRPNGSARNSFPSGHTATAFLGAELVRLEYGGWAGAGAYAVATLTAVMRVYNNWHWFNDLLGGAAIGILSANIGYWLLPLERRLLGEWFGWEIGKAASSYRGSEIALVPFAAPAAVLFAAPVAGIASSPMALQPASGPTALGLSLSWTWSF